MKGQYAERYQDHTRKGFVNMVDHLMELYMMGIGLMESGREREH
jgi:hypothetical protein